MSSFARNQLQASTAAVVYYPGEGDYSDVLQKGFSDDFTSSGGSLPDDQIIGIEGHFDGASCDDIDFSDVIHLVGNADFIYAPLFEIDGPCFVKQLRQMGYATPVALPDSVFGSFLFDLLDPNTPDVFVSGVRTPSGPRFDQFRQDYQNKFGIEFIPGIENVYEPYAYDAANLLLNAIETVAVEEKQGDKNGGLWIPRGALRDALYATENFPGVTGNLSCDANGDCNLGSVQVYQAIGGEFVPIGL
jgi:branched-chain amino acid transport system substrate-binding protein